MKTSLRKLRGFALHHHRHDSRDRRESRERQPLAQWNELAQASQDMQDMRDCYDSLLSAAAATTNSAYEFSVSLREMGACLLEKTALNDDEESGKVLLMLGKLQFELQELIDRYRSHIVQTITIPSESLLNELRTVEEMKRQCDEKRNLYEYMITRQREKGRSRCGKGESFSSQQVQAAHDDYDEEATLFVFRLKSLKQGQSRSLLTQAARHHAAQFRFFKKALKSLEAVDPHVKVVTQQLHIDYHFTGLEEDEGEFGEDDYDDEDDDGYNAQDDGELSFDYGQIDEGQDVISASRNLMELDEADLTFPQVVAAEALKENLDKRQGDSFVFSRELKTGSQSAPLFAEKKLDPGEMIGQMQPSSRRKFHTYVLPTPVDTKNSVPGGSGNSVPHTRQTGAHNLWHSSPLEPKKHEKTFGDKKLSGTTVVNAPSVLKESNNNIVSPRLPPPLAEGLLLPQLNPRATSYSKRIRSFSGPLTRSAKPVSSTNMEQPKIFSGHLLRNPMAQPSSSPRVSHSASPSFVSSPKISELHELPRPPSSFAESARPLGLVGHSAPLVFRGQVFPATNKVVVSSTASPLPTPPRSFSIPSSGQRAVLSQMSQPLESLQNLEMAEDIASPPLTPISLSNIQMASTASVTVISAFQI